LLQQANGGYIIFQAKDLLANGICYEALKKYLRVKEIGIENPAEQRSAMLLIALKPEPIPLDVKVILIGNAQLYHSLLEMDPDFRKLFKIKSEFEDDAIINEENVNKLARFIHSFCEQEQLPHLDRSAMARIIEYASRLAGNNTKLSTNFNDISQVIGEAGTWTRLAKAKVVTEDFINKALFGFSLTTGQKASSIVLSLNLVLTINIFILFFKAIYVAIATNENVLPTFTLSLFQNDTIAIYITPLSIVLIILVTSLILSPGIIVITIVAIDSLYEAVKFLYFNLDTL